MSFINFINAIFLLVAGALVAFSANPVNSAVFLIATFVNAAFLLFFLGVDFLSLVFIVVYVGAIAVLFLFVVMMLAIKEREVNFLSVSNVSNLLENVCFGFLSLVILLSNCEAVFSAESSFLTTKLNTFFVDYFDGLAWFGQFFFNYFDSSFLIVGLILLIALIGAILLTHTFYSGVKPQNFLGQLSASGCNTVIKFELLYKPKSVLWTSNKYYNPRENDGYGRAQTPPSHVGWDDPFFEKCNHCIFGKIINAKKSFSYDSIISRSIHLIYSGPVSELELKNSLGLAYLPVVSIRGRTVKMDSGAVQTEFLVRLSKKTFFLPKTFKLSGKTP